MDEFAFHITAHTDLHKLLCGAAKEAPDVFRVIVTIDGTSRIRTRVDFLKLKVKVCAIE